MAGIAAACFFILGGIPLNVKGNIYYLPCDVSTDTKYQEVNFGTLLNIDFQTAGTASEWKTFSLNVENCPVGTTKATVKFDGVTDGDDATHFANMAASDAAQNIALQITNTDHSTTYKNQDRMTIAINGSTGKGELRWPRAYIQRRAEQKWENSSRWCS